MARRHINWGLGISGGSVEQDMDIGTDRHRGY